MKNARLTFVSRAFRKAAATYSPTWWGSTIGAGGFNFSVRDGKRWFPTALTAAVFYLREINAPSGAVPEKKSGYSKDLGLLVQVD